jgi:hypothetical protein
LEPQDVTATPCERCTNGCTSGPSIEQLAAELRAALDEVALRRLVVLLLSGD